MTEKKGDINIKHPKQIMESWHTLKDFQIFLVPLCKSICFTRNQRLLISDLNPLGFDLMFLVPTHGPVDKTHISAIARYVPATPIVKVKKLLQNVICSNNKHYFNISVAMNRCWQHCLPPPNGVHLYGYISCGW